jgi:transposase-like protein
MKQNRVSPRRRAPRTDASQRAQLLAAFDRSGLSAADFARQHGVHYTTFSGWRQRRDRAKASPAFVQVELASPSRHKLADAIVRLQDVTESRLDQILLVSHDDAFEGKIEHVVMIRKTATEGSAPLLST